MLLVDAARARVYRPLTRKGSGSRLPLHPGLGWRNGTCGSTTPLCSRSHSRSARRPWDRRCTAGHRADLLARAGDAGRHAAACQLSHRSDPPRGANARLLPVRQPFTYRPAGQRFLIMINAVYTSSSFTSVAWTILSIEAGRGLGAASTPPFADAEPPRRAYNQISARGPQIKVGTGRPVWRARLVTTNSRAAGHWNACVPTCGPGLPRYAGPASRCVWSPICRPSVSTSTVDIVFPGLTTLTDVAVTPAPDSTFRSAGPAVRGVGFWTFGRTRHILAGDTGLADPAAAAEIS